MVTFNKYVKIDKNPNLVILNPCDAVEAEKAAEAMLQYVGPVLLRQESSPPPMGLFTPDLPFDIGKAFSLRDGKDELAAHFGLRPEDIAVAVKNAIEKKKEMAKR